ncbi:hypothetical protein [Candidatus Spongiihabitans sp.]|uniref:hypothetical protein n=1 Tax=Candidatus Spongiihabitans sp. TaxID=3101308 RepID=UPI003C79D065
MVFTAVAQNSTAQIEEWRKSAEQGEAWAQHSLGVAYYCGEGVAEDKREAYIWYSIAKANGGDKAADESRNTNWRDVLSQREIYSAQSDVVDYIRQQKQR